MPTSFRRILYLVLVFVTSLLATDTTAQSVGRPMNRDRQETRTQPSSRTDQRRVDRTIPPSVYSVLRYIRTSGKAPEGYVGGRRFGNYEGHLPRRDLSGEAIRYQEWDVNPKVPGRNRGAERLVTGSDGRAWYTRDHYNSFVEIK